MRVARRAIYAVCFFSTWLTVVSCSSAPEAEVESQAAHALVTEPNCIQLEDYIRGRAIAVYRAGGGLLAAPERQLTSSAVYNESEGQTVVSNETGTYALSDGRVVALDGAGTVVKAVAVEGISQRMVALGSIVTVVGRTEGVLPWRGRGPAMGGVPCETLGMAGDGRGTFGADSELRSLRGPVTRITVVDMATGLTLRSVVYEGEFVALRRVANTLHVVSRGDLYFPPVEGYKTEDEYWIAVTQQFLHEWLPRRIDTRGEDSLTDQVARCEEHVLGHVDAGGGFIIGLTLNLADPTETSINRVGLGLGYLADIGEDSVITVYPNAWDTVGEQADTTLVHALALGDDGLAPLGSVEVEGNVSPNRVADFGTEIAVASHIDGQTKVGALVKGTAGLTTGSLQPFATQSISELAQAGDELAWNLSDTLRITQWDGGANSLVSEFQSDFPVAVGASDNGLVRITAAAAVTVSAVDGQVWNADLPQGATVDLKTVVVRPNGATLVPYYCGDLAAGWISLDGSPVRYLPAPSIDGEFWCGPAPAALSLTQSAPQIIGHHAVVDYGSETMTAPVCP
ncbi:MAG: hypothetical protein ACI9OJ_000119 [Myxococcota bacterium]|jgi:hypothetical protein